MIGRRVAIGGGAVAGVALLYQLFAPNSTYDKVTAKYVWCSPQQGQTQNPEVIDSPNFDPRRKLDWAFTGLRNGDSIKFGELELKAVDSRRQEVFYGPNKNDDLTMASLGCPGYVKLDIYHKGKLVPGGSGVEIVYAKFGGGMFDGWPNFNLEDVLKATKLTPEGINALLRESAEIVARRRIQMEEDRKRTYDIARAEIIAANERAVATNPQLKGLVDGCKKLFLKHDDNSFIYRIRWGDSKVSISGKFAGCNNLGAFFPYFHTVDIYSGKNVINPTDPTDEKLLRGSTALIVPSRTKDLAEPLYFEKNRQMIDEKRREMLEREKKKHEKKRRSANVQRMAQMRKL